ncbi:hypothetical protein U1Q18_043250, partial [Sarracenia purpurea var. burkii]
MSLTWFSFTSDDLREFGKETSRVYISTGWVRPCLFSLMCMCVSGLAGGLLACFWNRRWYQEHLDAGDCGLMNRQYLVERNRSFSAQLWKRR